MILVWTIGYLRVKCMSPNEVLSITKLLRDYFQNSGCWLLSMSATYFDFSLPGLPHFYFAYLSLAYFVFATDAFRTSSFLTICLPHYGQLYANQLDNWINGQIHRNTNLPRLSHD